MSTGETWTLGHRPALDGLRGIAVLMVVAEHVGILTLGQVGVSVFFTLSGFLITTLLLDEHEGTGRVDLSRFYRRRLLRLAPALVTMVAAVALVGVMLGPAFVTAPQVASALGYVSNWWFISDGMDGALLHTWSLGVEEQFYVIFPVALLALLRHSLRAAAVAMVGGILFAVAMRAYLWGEGVSLVRIGYGFDTRLDGLMVGCLLAVLVRRRSEGRSHSLVAIAALGGTVAVGFIPVSSAPVAWPLVVAVLAAVMIHACVHGAGVWWLSGSWLTLIGRRSYGLYLWHFPLLLVAQMVPVSSAVALPLALAAAWGVTLLSWRWIEAPFLRRRLPITGSRPRDCFPVATSHQTRAGRP